MGYKYDRLILKHIEVGYKLKGIYFPKFRRPTARKTHDCASQAENSDGRSERNRVLASILSLRDPPSEIACVVRSILQTFFFSEVILQRYMLQNTLWSWRIKRVIINSSQKSLMLKCTFLRQCLGSLGYSFKWIIPSATRTISTHLYQFSGLPGLSSSRITDFWFREA